MLLRWGKTIKTEFAPQGSGYPLNHFFQVGRDLRSPAQKKIYAWRARVLGVVERGDEV